MNATRKKMSGLGSALLLYLYGRSGMRLSESSMSVATAAAKYERLKCCLSHPPALEGYAGESPYPLQGGSAPCALPHSDRLRVAAQTYGPTDPAITLAVT